MSSIEKVDEKQRAKELLAQMSIGEILEKLKATINEQNKKIEEQNKVIDGKNEQIAELMQNIKEVNKQKESKQHETIDDHPKHITTDLGAAFASAINISNCIICGEKFADSKTDDQNCKICGCKDGERIIFHKGCFKSV